MEVQHAYNIVHTAAYYALIGCAFFFASTGSRHFAVAVGGAFVIAPYLVLSISSQPDGWRIVAAFIAIGACAAFGLLYARSSAALTRRGSGPGELLLISIAVLAVLEQTVAAVFGSGSNTLWPLREQHLLRPVAGLSLTAQGVLFVFTSTLIVGLVWMLWRRSSAGLQVRALVDSRVGLALRGYNVARIDLLLCGTGFMLAGVAGVLWSTELSIKPGSGLEAAVAGVVTAILGPLLAVGVWGIVAASLLTAGVRFGLTVSFEGDWNMTAMLCALLVAVLTRTARRSVSAMVS